jgi:hypothetical protein
MGGGGLRKGFTVLTPFLDITFTKANSTSAVKTNTRHVIIHTSMALIYETRGRFELAPVLWVVMVRTVSRPSDTRAGIASTLIQNDTQERMTIKILGTYTWMRKYPMSLRRTKRISRQGKAPAQTRA